MIEKLDEEEHNSGHIISTEKKKEHQTSHSGTKKDPPPSGGGSGDGGGSGGPNPPLDVKEALLNAINENNPDKFLSLLASSGKDTMKSIAGSLSEAQIETLLTSDGAQKVLDDKDPSGKLKDLLEQVVAQVSNELKKVVFTSIAKVASGEKSTLGRSVLEALIKGGTIDDDTMNCALASVGANKAHIQILFREKKLNKSDKYFENILRRRKEAEEEAKKKAQKVAAEKAVKDKKTKISGFVKNIEDDIAEAKSHFQFICILSGEMKDMTSAKTIKDFLADKKFKEAADYVQKRIKYLGGSTDRKVVNVHGRARLRTYKEKIKPWLENIITLQGELSTLKAPQSPKKHK